MDCKKRRFVLFASRPRLGKAILLGAVLAIGAPAAGNEGKVTFFGSAQEAGKIGATIHYVKPDGTKDSCKVMGTWTHLKWTTPDVKAKQLAKDISDQCVGITASAAFSTVTIKSGESNTITEIDIDDDTDQETTINPQSLDDGKKSCSIRIDGAATDGTVILRLDACGAEARVPAASKTGSQIASELAAALMPCDPGCTVVALDMGGESGEVHIVGLSNANSIVSFWSGGAFGLDCTFGIKSLGAPRSDFRRDDANDDGGVDISDAVLTLNALFLGAPAKDCDDAMDSNDDGAIDISDAVFSLGALFLGGRSIPPPHPACGVDPSEDPLGCNRQSSCPSCLDPGELGLLARESIEPTVCLPPDVGRAVLGGFEARVCPSWSDATCGPPENPGCGISMPLVAAAFDLPGSRILVHIEALAEDLPVGIIDLGLPGGTTCEVDIPRLWMEVVLPLALGAPEGDAVRVADVLMPHIQSIDLEGAASGELICAGLSTPSPILAEALRPALATALLPGLLEMRARLIGSSLCLP